MLDFQIGDIVAERYEIKQVLGAGGMGKVYRARQVDLGRDVALKVPSRAVMESPEIMARFSREAKTVAKLSHENIVQVYEYYQDADLAFIAMEYVEGKDLKETTVYPPPDLTAGDMGQILELACEGMSHAHEAGIVHRDIKPHNIMVARLPRGKWRVKVMDFGIAHIEATQGFTEMGGQLTQTGQALGTPSYMSPEQIRGSGISHLSDLYSFGCVIYFCFTRQTVFTGSGLTVAVSHLNEPPPSLRRAAPNMPEQLDNLILRCLEKDPARRPQSAAQLGEMIRNAMGAIGNTPMAEIWRATGQAPDATIQIVQGSAGRPDATEADPGSLVTLATQQTIASTSTPAPQPVAPYQPSPSPVPVASPGPVAPAASPTPATAAAPPRAGNKGILLGGIVLAACAFVGIVGGVGFAVMKGGKKDGGEDPVVATPTPTATPTSVAVEPTPAPTPVPAQPTPTPLRTPEPTPSPVPTPAISPERTVLRNLQRDFGQTRDMMSLAGLWGSADRLARNSADPDAAVEALQLADAIALRLTQNPEMIIMDRTRFTMGTNTGASGEGPEHNVSLDEFAIGRFEVTALEFACFLNSIGDEAKSLYQPGDALNIVWDADRNRWEPQSGRELHPANGVTWFAAVRYTDWLSNLVGTTYTLPTEAQWERAAKGTTNRRYPWGPAEPTSAHANYNTNGTERIMESPDRCTSEQVADMSGNVAEWCRDWYVETAYRELRHRDNPCVEEAPGDARPRRILRGGGFTTRFVEDLTTTSRGRLEPESSAPDVGFRLARRK